MGRRPVKGRRFVSVCIPVRRPFRPRVSREKDGLSAFDCRFSRPVLWHFCRSGRITSRLAFPRRHDRTSYPRISSFGPGCRSENRSKSAPGYVCPLTVGLRDGAFYRQALAFPVRYNTNLRESGRAERRNRLRVNFAPLPYRLSSSRYFRFRRMKSFPDPSAARYRFLLNRGRIRSTGKASTVIPEPVIVSAANSEFHSASAVASMAASNSGDTASLCRSLGV